MAKRQDASTGEIIDDGKEPTKTGGMQVKVYSPFKVYFEGTAESISAASATGDFDILGQHHNFITLLVPCELIVRVKDAEPETFDISGGVMHVKQDEVVVFLDI